MRACAYFYRKGGGALWKKTAQKTRRPEDSTPSTPRHQAHKKKKSGTAKTVIGTILAIGLTTCLMFFAIFMVYVHTSLDLNVDISAYTLKQSSTVYYQDKASGEWGGAHEAPRRREPARS